MEVKCVPFVKRTGMAGQLILSSTLLLKLSRVEKRQKPTGRAGLVPSQSASPPNKRGQAFSSTRYWYPLHYWKQKWAYLQHTYYNVLKSVCVFILIKTD